MDVERAKGECSWGSSDIAARLVLEFAAARSIVAIMDEIDVVVYAELHIRPV